MIIRVFDNQTELTVAAAEKFVTLARKAIEAHGRFTVALAGGSTPEPLYALLATPAYHQAIDWHQAYIFFGDEHTVAPDQPDSNFRMAHETLLAHVPEAHVYRIMGEIDPAVAADAYAGQLRTVFGDELPRFDLMLQGMGDDGHTASLFPYTTALEEADRWVVTNNVPKFNTTRITMTYPVLNNARAVLFLVSGSNKADALKQTLEGPKQFQAFPAQAVQPSDGELLWYVDAEAASKITRN